MSHRDARTEQIRARAHEYELQQCAEYVRKLKQEGEQIMRERPAPVSISVDGQELDAPQSGPQLVQAERLPRWSWFLRGPQGGRQQLLQRAFVGKRNGTTTAVDGLGGSINMQATELVQPVRLVGMQFETIDQ